MKVQPSKIILINAANCHYAEFDLSDSLHLIALNNRGKTSIVNTLQFLYIDNYNGIDMGEYSLDKTWGHYFPQLGSYVLFELNTLSGNKVFGLAATGMGAAPEKFIFDGHYQSNDFIDKKEKQYQPRKPGEVFPQLAAKNIRRNLDPKAHRDLLKPYHKQKNTEGLGIIGDISDYQLFKRLFKQLLQVKGITINVLKNQIEQVNRGGMEQQQIINVQREFNEPYSVIQKSQNELKHLQNNSANIEELLELNKDQKRLEGRLCSYFLKADKLFVDENEKLQSEKDNYENSKQRLEYEKLPSIRLQKEEKQKERDGFNQKLGVLDSDIDKYEKLEKYCQGIVIELEQEKAKQLEIEAKKLQKKLFQAEDVNLANLEKTLQSKQQQKESFQVQLDNITNTLFANLKKILNAQQLEKLYRLTNTKLWKLFNTQDFELYDPQALEDFLQTHLQTEQENEYHIPGLKLKLTSISAQGINKLGDPDSLPHEIEKLEKEINDLKTKIDIVQNQEKLRQQYQELQHKIKKCERILSQYEQWQQGQELYQQQLEQRKILKLKIEQYQKEINELDDKYQETNRKIEQYKRDITRIEKEQKELNDQKSWIETHQPDRNWEAIEINYETPKFIDLYEQYKSLYKDQQKHKSDIQEKLSRLRKVFPKMAGMNDVAALNFLHEQLSAIPEQEKGIQDQWKGIFTSFAGHCRGMIDNVKTIESYLVDLDRLLSKQTISNLKSVKVYIETNQWYRHISRIRDWNNEDLPLFGRDEREGEKLQQAIQPLLNKVEISIADLYDLKLSVIDQQGQEKHYQNLKLESNGTSITIKVIIFISMINKAMEGKHRLGENIRIPFYVDEIDSLDDTNAQNIHDTAQEQGLIPIFASPKGSGICKRLYQLSNHITGNISIHEKINGKLVLSKPTFERIA